MVGLHRAVGNGCRTHPGLIGEGRTLEADIATVFGSHPLRTAYLEQVLTTGRPSQAGRLWG